MLVKYSKFSQYKDFGYIKLHRHHEFCELLHVLVVPGGFHFLEKAALIKIAQAPEDI